MLWICWSLVAGFVLGGVTVTVVAAKNRAAADRVFDFVERRIK